MREICSKLQKDKKTTSMTFSGVFIVKFEQNSHIVLVFLLLTLDKKCQLVTNEFLLRK